MRQIRLSKDRFSALHGREKSRPECFSNIAILRAFAVVFIVFMCLLIPNQRVVAGCSGPCFSCHPQLQDKPDHKSLGTCAVCHDGNLKRLSVVPKSNINGGCGDRCFQCHNEWPKDSYHFELNQCLNCHNP